MHSQNYQTGKQNNVINKPFYVFFFVLDLTIKYSGKFFFIIESFFLALKMRQILRRFYQLNKLLLYNENMLPQIKKKYI